MDYETLTEEDFNNFTEDEIYDFITYYEIATEEELQLVTTINGYSIETLNDIIYARSAYHDCGQYYACEVQNNANYFEDLQEEEEEEV